MSARVPSGVHLLTPDRMDRDELLQRTEQAIEAGVTLVQYRNKQLDSENKKQHILALRTICRGRVPLIVNDSPELAAQTEADGVHLGPEDDSIKAARSKLGDEALIGASCRGDAELAERAAQQGADYLAFGCCFASRTKPEAPLLPEGRLAQLVELAERLQKASIAIGGIGRESLSELAARPHAIAVCAEIFSAKDSGKAAAEICSAFERLRTLP